MPTAIDKIKEAESRAAEIRSQALLQAREDLRAAQEKISAEQKEKISAARHKARESLEAKEKEMAAQSEALLEKNMQAKQAFKQDASAGVKKAADIIIKGILDI